jgi:multidrug efflux system membrane fusion protein
MKKAIVAFVVVAGLAGAGYYTYSKGYLDGALRMAGLQSWAAKKAPAQAAAGGQGQRQGRGRGRRGNQGPAPVTVAKAGQQTVPVTIETIGQMQAFATVAVKSRVDGQVMEVFFKDGQFVKKGEPLFRIDPRPLQAKVNEVEANLARDRAQLANAKSDLARYKKLAQSGFSSQQKFDQAQATAAALEAALKANTAALERARLELSYTRISAPIDARAGSVLVDPGNLVKANDGLTLVVLNQIKPVYVSFAVPEQNLAEIKGRMAGGPVGVELFVPGGTQPRVSGRVVFINNAVDAATGTIQLKAEVPNEDERLIPGQFVRVSLVLHEIKDAVVVPVAAVQNGQNGSFIYVMNDQKRVRAQNVTVGPQAGNVVVIEKGLEAGETIVTEGQMRLRPNALVATQEDRAKAQAARGKRGGGKEGRGRRNRDGAGGGGEAGGREGRGGEGRRGREGGKPRTDS